MTLLSFVLDITPPPPTPHSFPTVDFHMQTQRLAVGTSEGAIIMYDLKTGTRLYVLEAHKKRPAACSFSPDGRRLVTVSLEEGVVLVWKVRLVFGDSFHWTEERVLSAVGLVCSY